MHPEDAAARRIREGQRVRVWNERGTVTYRARLTDRLLPGMVAAPFGNWTRDGASVGVLETSREYDVEHPATERPVLL
jgi:anaerobic dimethyl sulfoxide reductase subunit A